MTSRILQLIFVRIKTIFLEEFLKIYASDYFPPKEKNKTIQLQMKINVTFSHVPISLSNKVDDAA